MALKDEAKKTYQREYMRGYMKRLRLKERLLRPSTSRSVKTPIDAWGWIGAHAYHSENIEADKEPIKHILIDADGNVIYEEG